MTVPPTTTSEAGRRPDCAAAIAAIASKIAVIRARIIGSQSAISLQPLHNGSGRPLRYYINVTLDGCCDHRAMFADEDLHRHAVENLDQADALLFGRVTYEMMEAAWRPPA